MIDVDVGVDESRSCVVVDVEFGLCAELVGRLLRKSGDRGKVSCVG
jgi:hypothetical protein